MTDSIKRRVEKIQKEHIELLQMARDSICNNGDNFNEHITDLVTVLDCDESNVKKYAAVVNAQELITELTEEILEAKTVDEVVELRKRLNYYINKIKAELRKREVPQLIIDDYQNKAGFLRKGIAGYIRFLKREDNVLEIERLSNNYANLSKEEITTLRKCLRKENSYNVRNKKSYMAPSEVKKPSKEDFSLSEVYLALSEINSTDNSEDFDIKPYNLESSFGDQDFFIPSLAEAEQTSVIAYPEKLSFDETSTYFNHVINKFSSQYGVEKTFDYEKKGLGRNIIHFFRNIPHYIHNKKAVKRMKQDYLQFYRGSDLASFIAYTKKKSSIKQELKCLFESSRLYTSDTEYLKAHERCARWMYDFCLENSLPICVSKGRTC